MSRYQPPLTLTLTMLALVAEISERVGRWSALNEDALTPQLRRENRIRTIQASLAIENNTLSVEQVTAVLQGKRVLGLPREIQEVRNAMAAYDQLGNWQPDSRADLLAAHGTLMFGLLDDAGHLRREDVGIYRGSLLVHMAPPVSRVPALVDDVLAWLGQSNWHPLISSCAFHYEFEFIHPFADGNGRMGRLWQTLLLSRWRPVLAYLPVETVIRDRQADYYAALAAADQAAEATPFVEFMLQALLTAMQEMATSEQVTDQVSEQVQRLLTTLADGNAWRAAALMTGLGLQHRPTFSKNYLTPALEAGLVELTNPDSPRSPQQRYRLSSKGRRVVNKE